MLVPFGLNEKKIEELKIPHHIADWHRVRILKEIDDIRYQAMTTANLELNGESMLALKKLKLFSLFNPVFDTENHKVKSYDIIVEAFDIPIEWYFSAAMELYDFLRRNKLSVDANAMTKAIRDDALKVVSNFQGTKCFFFFLGSSNLAMYKDAIISCFNFIYYKGNYDFSNEENLTFWNYKPYLVPGRDCVAMEYRATYSDYLLARNETSSTMTNISYGDVQLFHYKYNYNRNAYNDYYFDTQLRNTMYYFFDPTLATTPEILKLELVLGYISSNIMHFATIADTLDVLRNTTITSVVDRGIPVVASEPNLNYMPNSTTSTILDLGSSDGRRYSLTVPNKEETYYQFYKTQNVNLANGKTYYLPSETFKYPDPSNPSGLRQNVGIGTSYIPPTYPPDDKTLLFWIRDFKLNSSAVSVDNQSKLFSDKNKDLQNFPRYFPRMLLFRVNRVRNGLLYSDASKFYQLEYIEYPAAIKDKIENLIFQQEAIDSLVKDINEKFYEFEIVNGQYNWFFYEFGVKVPFLHPVTQKPVSVVRYLYELIFEMIVSWGGVQKDIDAFFETKKIQNDAAFNQAYQNYLRGQATIQDLFNYERLSKQHGIVAMAANEAMQEYHKASAYYFATYAPLYNEKKITIDELNFHAGELEKIRQKYLDLSAQQYALSAQLEASKSAAVLLFEEKLKTGLFYLENGMEYWRPFTTTELALIEKLKNDAYKNAEIAKQNEQTRLLNQQYQNAANLPIIRSNEEKLLQAKLIAMPELRAMAEKQIASIVAPTVGYLIERAEKEGGFPTDILNKWVQENPYYFLRPDLASAVNTLLNDLTFREQQVASAMVADVIAEAKFTKALQEIFQIKG